MEPRQKSCDDFYRSANASDKRTRQPKRPASSQRKTMFHILFVFTRAAVCLLNVNMLCGFTKVTQLISPHGKFQSVAPMFSSFHYPHLLLHALNVLDGSFQFVPSILSLASPLLFQLTLSFTYHIIVSFTNPIMCCSVFSSIYSQLLLQPQTLLKCASAIPPGVPPQFPQVRLHNSLLPCSIFKHSLLTN